MEHNILIYSEGDLDPQETTRRIIEIAARHEKQLELAAEIARIELERRRQAADDRAQAAEVG
jgi:L-2-hydroxyglutarate oxidase LhgO